VSKAKRIPTIDDVAEVAGVSKRTVSRVINKSDLVKAKTREKVEQVISDLNYRPNRHARGLASSRSYMIGLVYDVPTLHIADIQKGILNVAYETGFELVVHACHIQTENLVDEVLEFVARTKVDGVVVLPPVSEVKELGSELDRMGCHYVEFSSELSSKPWKQVVTNYLPAITDMTSHLVNLGHRKFGFISGPKTSIPSRKRQQAFSKALRQFDLKLPRTMIAEGAFTYASGVRAAEKLLSRKDRPTAIFAGNDEMAFGVMNVANRMGIVVPDQLSVVGFDGTAFAEFVIPSLSTIRRPSNTMSELGAKKLIARICEGRDAARAFEVMVSPQYAPGESTGPAPED
jgi:LacI family transcriptional regulator